MNQAMLCGVAACALLLSAALAAAGTCPPDQVLAEARVLDMPPDTGVNRPTIGAVQLKGWRDLGNFTLRMRRITVAPGGMVPTHPHDDRPSIVLVLDGEIEEHSEHCAVPILHRAGEVTTEFGPGRRHWWRNATETPVVLMATDVVPWLDIVKEEHSPDDTDM